MAVIIINKLLHLKTKMRKKNLTVYFMVFCYRGKADGDNAGYLLQCSKEKNVARTSGEEQREAFGGEEEGGIEGRKEGQTSAP